MRLTLYDRTRVAKESTAVPKFTLSGTRDTQDIVEVEKLTSVTVIRKDGFRETRRNGRRRLYEYQTIKARIKICFMCEIKGFASGFKHTRI